MRSGDQRYLSSPSPSLAVVLALFPAWEPDLGFAVLLFELGPKPCANLNFFLRIGAKSPRLLAVRHSSALQIRRSIVGD